MSVRHVNPQDDRPSAPSEQGKDGKLGRGVRSLPRKGDDQRIQRTLLLASIAIASMGALLVGAGAAVGIVEPGTPPGFVSWPLLLALAAGPSALAAVWLRMGRPAAAVGSLAAATLIAAGRLVVDLRLVVDAGLAARPALLLPRDLDTLEPAVGLWLLLAGHAAVSLAGCLAIWAGGRSDNSDQAELLGATENGHARPGRQSSTVLATLVGVVGGLSIVIRPFGSENPYLVPHGALDSPLLVLIGTLVIAVAVPVTAVVVTGTGARDLAMGGLAGLALATAGVLVPPLAAAVALPLVHAGWSSLLGVVAIGGFALVAAWVGCARQPGEIDELRLPALTRLRTATGGLAIAAGVTAIAAAVAPQLHLPAESAEMTTYSARLLFPAGAVLVLLGAGSLMPRSAKALRPALTVAWVVLPLVGAATLDTVLAAAEAAGASAGLGMWLLGVAALLGVLAAVLAGLAGAVERDDVDLTALTVRRSVLVPSVLAGLLALATFGLPVVTAPGYAPPGIVTEFSTTSWGLWAALVAVLVAVVLAPACRPRQAMGLLGGAVAVVGVRVLELPLTADRATGSSPGLGLWFGLACLGMLVLTATLAATSWEQ